MNSGEACREGSREKFMVRASVDNSRLVFSRKRSPKATVTDLWMYGAWETHSHSCSAKRIFFQAIRCYFSKEGAQRFLVYEFIFQGWSDLRAGAVSWQCTLSRPGSLRPQPGWPRARPRVSFVPRFLSGPAAWVSWWPFPAPSWFKGLARPGASQENLRQPGLLFQISNPADLCAWLVNRKFKTRMHVIAVIYKTSRQKSLHGSLQNVSPLQIEWI